MKTKLVCKSKLFSLRGQIRVYDDSAALVYNVARPDIFSTGVLVDDRADDDHDSDEV